jgi:hypothetical protein
VDDKLVSKRGIVLAYSVGDAIFNDGEASYVDDLLDGFDNWNEKGSLKGHIESLFRKEIALFNAFAQHQPPTMLDHVTANRMILDKKLELLVKESEIGLKSLRDAYLRSPRTVIEMMLKAARGAERQILSVGVTHGEPTQEADHSIHPDGEAGGSGSGVTNTTPEAGANDGLLEEVWACYYDAVASGIDDPLVLILDPADALAKAICHRHVSWLLHATKAKILQLDGSLTRAVPNFDEEKTHVQGWSINIFVQMLSDLGCPSDKIAELRKVRTAPPGHRFWMLAINRIRWMLAPVPNVQGKDE